jgi:hypothetical protein
MAISLIQAAMDVTGIRDPQKIQELLKSESVNSDLWVKITTRVNQESATAFRDPEQRAAFKITENNRTEQSRKDEETGQSIIRLEKGLISRNPGTPEG